MEMIRDGIGLERGKVGGSGALESLIRELEEKREPKSVALSVGEQATEPSGRMSEGKLELLKFLKIFLVKDQKVFSVGEEVRRSAFFRRKEALALRI